MLRTFFTRTIYYWNRWWGLRDGGGGGGGGAAVLVAVYRDVRALPVITGRCSPLIRIIRCGRDARAYIHNNSMQRAWYYSTVIRRYCSLASIPCRPRVDRYHNIAATIVTIQYEIDNMIAVNSGIANKRPKNTCSAW